MCLGIRYWYRIWVLGLGRYVNWLWVCGGCECVTDGLLASELCTGVVSLWFLTFSFGTLGKGVDRNHPMCCAELPQLHSEQLIYCLSPSILVCQSGKIRWSSSFNSCILPKKKSHIQPPCGEYHCRRSPAGPKLLAIFRRPVMGPPCSDPLPGSLLLNATIQSVSRLWHTDEA